MKISNATLNLLRQHGDPSLPWHRVRRSPDRKPGQYATDEATRLLAKERRDGLRAKGLCINGASHGKATHGCLCKSCRETHRRSN